MDRRHRWFAALTVALTSLALSSLVGAEDRILVGQLKRDSQPRPGTDNFVKRRCLGTNIDAQKNWPVERARPWSLPARALAPTFDTTIHILVLRFNFQYETIDDANTTGRGQMDLRHPLTVADSIQYYAEVGHWIDPPPHDSQYFDAQLRALRNYWEWVSEGKITLSWDISPPWRDSVYQLPYPMNHYGRCDSVVIGLENFFTDCIQLADTAHLVNPNYPDIDFSQYGAIIIFHAGSDRQNDIGFPETCSDLFTGFIRFGDSVAVDNGTRSVRTALLVPETSSQDGRATALNAVLAHEFGHQLGLIDLYSTANFLSQLGDFSLMDDNGFGTGIDFGFRVGQVFGGIPIYPDAWSRAFLGLTPVADFRKGSDIRVVAAEVASSGLKIARVPISENEYYLIENRIQETDGRTTAIRADSTTNVIQSPVDSATKAFTGEYDVLTPGSGMLIYRVDESVAALDYDGDGLNNFEDNDLQWDPRRKFVTLVEADGLVNFGGYYRAGFGSAEDMYRDDRSHSLTPNTNPPSTDNTGNDTHIYVTDIRRDTIRLPGARDVTHLDSVMFFDVETDGLTSAFPVRAGYPQIGLSAIADDLNGDGTDELIVASGRLLSVMTTDGRNFLLDIADTCAACPRFIDTAFASVNPGVPHEVPLYIQTIQPISAGPVTGSFPDDPTKLVAVGYPLDPTRGRVTTYYSLDFSNDGRADDYGNTISTQGVPIALSFGQTLYALTDNGTLYRQDSISATSLDSIRRQNDQYHGICRIADRVVLMAGDNIESKLYYWGSQVDSFSLGGYYSLGPIVADFNADGLPEVAAFSPDGDGLYVTIDTNGSAAGPATFSVLASAKTGFVLSTNPIAGDVDLDNYPDVIVGGRNTLYAFNGSLLLKANFPIQIDDRFPDVDVIAAPVTADIRRDGPPETILPTDIGNLYSFGNGLTPGFPLSAGEKGAGSPLLFHDSTGGKLGFLGADGWFYSWNVDLDTVHNLWPMGGHDPAGTFALDPAQLGTPQAPNDLFARNQFFNYPNPVLDGRTSFRYVLGRPARKVSLTVYDLSGRRVTEFDGSINQGENERSWNCADVTPGVYRCRIEVDFGSDTKTGFTDVAIIR